MYYFKFQVLLSNVELNIGIRVLTSKTHFKYKNCSIFFLNDTMNIANTYPVDSIKSL